MKAKREGEIIPLGGYWDYLDAPGAPRPDEYPSGPFTGTDGHCHCCDAGAYECWNCEQERRRINGPDKTGWFGAGWKRDGTVETALFTVGPFPTEAEAVAALDEAGLGNMPDWSASRGTWYQGE